jgi:hypothetical protein
MPSSVTQKQAESKKAKSLFYAEEALIYSTENKSTTLPQAAGYVGTLWKFIVLWGLLPTYRLHYIIEPPQRAGENLAANEKPCRVAPEFFVGLEIYFIGGSYAPLPSSAYLRRQAERMKNTRGATCATRLFFL